MPRTADVSPDRSAHDFVLDLQPGKPELSSALSIRNTSVTMAQLLDSQEV